MVILGGALLLTPGFITDVFGIICLLPPTRAVVWQLSKRFIVARIAFAPKVAYEGYRRTRGPGTPPPGRGPQPGDIEGSAHEVPDDPPELPPRQAPGQ